MPTVNDAARITTAGRAVWRTCGGCGLLSALPPAVDRCPGCDRPTDTDTETETQPAPDRSEVVDRYAATVGRIRAWADMPHVSDAERLYKIRLYLAELDRFHAAHRKGVRGCR